MTYNNDFDYNNSSNPNNEYRQEQQKEQSASPVIYATYQQTE